MRNMARTANRAARDLRGAANSARRAAADLNTAGRNANRAGQGLRNLGNQAGFAERRLHRLARRLRTIRAIRFGATGMVAGLGTGLVARQVGSTLIDYEKVMNKVLSKMADTVVKQDGKDGVILKGFEDGTIKERINDSTKALKMLRDETKRISRVSIFDPTQVGGGLLQLAQAGLTPEEAMKVLHPAVRLAAAGDISPEAAADMATNIANQFKLGLENTPDVVDILATAITNTNFDLPDLKASLKYAGASSFTAGQDLKGVTAALMGLAQVGEKGSSAGNSLARIFESLYKTSGPATKALKQIGLSQESFLNEEGRAIPLVEIMSKLSDAVKDKGFREVQRAIQALFQARGGRGAKAMIEMLDVIAKKRAWLDKAHGRAAMMEKLMMSGVYGAYEEMRSSIYEAIISLGEGGLAGDISSLAQSIKSMANSFSALSPETKKFIGRMFLVFTAVSAALIPLGVLAFSIASIAVVLGTLLSPIWLIIGALAVFATWLARKYDINLDDVIGALKALGDAINHPLEALEKLLNFSWGKIREGVRSLFPESWLVPDQVNEFRNNTPGAISKVLKNSEVERLPKDFASSPAGKVANSIWTNLKSFFGSASQLNDRRDLAAGSLAQSQADKELALKVETKNEVKVNAPASIVLKIPQGGIAGTIPLKTSVVSRGVTTPDAAAQ